MAIGKLNSYQIWRQEILLTHPTIIYLPFSAPMPDISQWIQTTNLDCCWNVSRFNIFDFQLGYDFFFKQVRDASFFRLAWGGVVDLKDPLVNSTFTFLIDV